MSRRSCAILTAALLCAAYPALGQQLPDGPGKELAQANCNICHTLLSRVGAGYTPEGWNTVLHMMVNQGAPLPADQIDSHLAQPINMPIGPAEFDCNVPTLDKTGVA